MMIKQLCKLKYILGILLFTWLSTSLSYASSQVDNNLFSWRNTKINIHLGVPVFTYSPLFHTFKIGQMKKDVGVGRRDIVAPDLSLEVLAAYYSKKLSCHLSVTKTC
jgi:hypothetical protein